MKRMDQHVVGAKLVSLRSQGPPWGRLHLVAPATFCGQMLAKLASRKPGWGLAVPDGQDNDRV
jgi:hypothetical protein